MNIRLFFVSLLLSLIIILLSLNSFAEEKLKIAVLDLEAKGVDVFTAENLTEVLLSEISEITDLNMYKIIGKSDYSTKIPNLLGFDL